MKISRKLAIKILLYLDKHRKFYFPFLVICKEYSDKENDFLGVRPEEWKMIQSDKKYQTFKLLENLQNLYPETLELMAKGFLEKITGESLGKHVAILAKNYRKEWKENLWESEDIEEFGFNEFIGGKAEGYEDCLEILSHYK